MNAVLALAGAAAAGAAAAAALAGAAPAAAKKSHAEAFVDEVKRFWDTFREPGDVRDAATGAALVQAAPAGPIRFVGAVPGLAEYLYTYRVLYYMNAVHFCQLCYAVDELVRRVAARAMWGGYSDRDVDASLAKVEAKLDETVLAVPTWVPREMAYMAPADVCCDRIVATFSDGIAAFAHGVSRRGRSLH